MSKPASIAVAAVVLFASSNLLAMVFAADAPAGPQPVEKSMHEFMEYVFEPGYKRLKPLMAAEPKDNAGWKGIKGDALSLAESCNLLLLRTPKEDGAVWTETSTAARDLGGQLYQAAKKKDYKLARTHYEAMLVKCNACHDKYAKGEHQLAP